MGSPFHRIPKRGHSFYFVGCNLPQIHPAGACHPNLHSQSSVKFSTTFQKSRFALNPANLDEKPTLSPQQCRWHFRNTLCLEPWKPPRNQCCHSDNAAVITEIVKGKFLSSLPTRLLATCQGCLDSGEVAMTIASIDPTRASIDSETNSKSQQRDRIPRARNTIKGMKRKTNKGDLQGREH